MIKHLQGFNPHHHLIILSSIFLSSNYRTSKTPPTMASLLLGTSSMASHILSLSSSKAHSISTLSLSSSPTLSLSTTVSTSPALPLIYCGRGDRKTAKGKRFNHSFGNARPRNNKKGRGPPKAPIPSLAPKQDPFATGESVTIEADDE